MSQMLFWASPLSLWSRDYLTKPLDVQRFLTIVSRILLQERAREEDLAMPERT